MSFTEQLKKARKNKGYTQEYIADIMGITKSTYCGYETGKRKPDIEKIKQIADILGVSGDFLLETGNEILDRLKFVIETAGLSYAELEKKTGIAKSSLQRYVSGTTKKIPIDAINAIAFATNIPSVWIMGCDKDNYLNQDMEIVSLLLKLSDDERQEVINYIKYISSRKKEK